MRRRRLFIISTFILPTALIGWYCAKQLDNPTSPTTAPVTKPPSANSPSLSQSGGVVESQTGYPDLTVDSARLANSIQTQTRNFKLTDCAVVEGCALPGRRKLLRFDVAMPNFGTADLVVGDPAKNPDLFEWSPCHGHFHYKNFSEYRLRDNSGVVLTSHKQAFCFIDVIRYDDGAPSNGYTCDNQGISVGWADLYNRGLDCQWLDITKVPKGNYLIEVIINKAGTFDEGSNLYPDSIDVPVTIRGGG